MPKLSDLLWDYIPDKQAFQGMGNDLLAAANRGGVAAVLGAPVDIANQLANLGRALYGYAGNKAGLLSADQMPQLDERPIGGSEWIGQKMQDAGLINGNRNHIAELLAGMVMPGAMLKGGVKANQAMDAAIANAQRPNTLNTPGFKGQRGAIVWHGSPHDIQPKPGGKYPEFDMSKIGTGEGAQAYGHGLYTAELPEVAQQYQQFGSWQHRANGQAQPVMFKDVPVQFDKMGNVVGDHPKGLKMFLARVASKGDFDYALNEVKQTLADMKASGSFPSIQNDLAEEIAQATANKSRIKASGAQGNLYKVDIPDEAIPRMLDWDKRMSQQSPEVQGLLGELATANQAHINGTPLRQFIYDNAKQSGSLPSVVIREIEKAGSLDAAIPALDQKFANANEAAKGKYGELMTLLRQHNISMDVMPDSVRTGGDIVRSGYNPPEIAEMLKARGIPGIRYLDGGSRSAGQGTSNYVLFDDKLGRILEKNGVPTGQTPWTPEEWAAYLSGGGK